MDIPLNADVHCADGPGGTSTTIVFNPVTQQVTHVVVQIKKHPHTDHLVPLDYVTETTPQSIQLRCTIQELEALEPFVEKKFVRLDKADIEYVDEPGHAWPYALHDRNVMPFEQQRVPPGEKGMDRGSRIEASDGFVGHLDEFLVDPSDGHITHVILRQGHLWGAKDITIPVSEIDRIERDTIYLTLDKQAVSSLPAVNAQRRWS